MGGEQKANGFCAACRPVRRMRRTGPAFPKKARRKPAAGRAGRGNASAAGCMLQAEPKSWKGSTEDMKLTFYGAAKAVTGSCHCMECNGKKILVVLPETNPVVSLSARNLQNVKVIPASNLNTYDVMNAAGIVLAETSVEAVNQMFGL